MNRIDPRGLAPGNLYDTPAAAGINAVLDVNHDKIEYGGRICQVPSGMYTYTNPNPGSAKGCNVGSCPFGTTNAGDYHTHGKYDPNYVQGFSPPDKDGNDSEGLPGYLGNENGSVTKYTPSSPAPNEGDTETVLPPLAP